MLVCFSHGKESGPWGTKITAMAEVVRRRGHEAESLDYRGMAEPEARVQKLVEHLAARHCPVLLVGSSMGGHVAAAASALVDDVAGLFLLAPAFFMPGYESLTPVPRAGRVVVVHGWSDDVVPVDNSVRWAGLHGADLHVYAAGHRLENRIGEICGLLGTLLDELGGARETA